MAEDQIQIVSTTDSIQQVREAAGLPADDAPTTEPVAPAAPAADPAPVAAPPAPKAKLTAKERINQLHGRNAELSTQLTQTQAEMQALRGRLDALAAPPVTGRPAETPDPNAVPPLPAKPKQDDYETMDLYLDARDEWMSLKAKRDAEEVYDSRRRADEQNSAQAQEYRRQEAVLASFAQRVEELRSMDPEYDAKIAAANMEITPTMRDFIIHEENGAKIGHYLATHPDEYQRVLKNADGTYRSPGHQLSALGRLDAKLETGVITLDLPTAATPAVVTPRSVAPRVSTAPTPEPRVSNVPPPPPRVSGGTVAPPATLAGARDMDEFRRLRAAGVKH